MNILRKALADEAARLKPLLDLSYNAILRYQQNRSPREEARLRDTLEPCIAQLMVFKPYMPTYKQDYFTVLEAEWRTMAPGDLIMLFDHCVDIMHLRMSRQMSANEAQQPWTRELLELLDKRRAAPPAGPSEGEFLCAGVAASPGQAAGPARVVAHEGELELLRPGEILVCRMSTPDWLAYLHLVRGVVTDQGGALCHAAIVARELGLPCVTGCQNATVTIQSGQHITVNGDLGIVTTIETGHVAR